jgi:hypothetical protein
METRGEKVNPIEKEGKLIKGTKKILFFVRLTKAFA